MPFDIQPLTPGALPELSRFLTEGFRTPADAAFAAADVLRWKYLDPRGEEAGEAPRSYLARDPGSGGLVGHIGTCPGRFHGLGLPVEGVSTLHLIDWLASGAGTGVGATLMHRAHRATATQFGFGGSADGRGVGGRGGYGLVRTVPVARRVLRPSHRLRAPGPGPAGRALRAAGDALRLVARPVRRPSGALELRPVATFGSEVVPLVRAYEPRALFTTRAPDLLNHLLRYPRGGLTGWHLVAGGEVCGFAVLGVVPRPGGVRLGKVAECLLAPEDADLWHAAAVALTAELKRQGADVAEAVASTPWAARAWRAAGFAPAHELEFRLRDRRNLLPRAGPFHLTFLEADYAYT